MKGSLSYKNILHIVVLLSTTETEAKVVDGLVQRLGPSESFPVTGNSSGNKTFMGRKCVSCIVPSRSFPQTTFFRSSKYLIMKRLLCSCYRRELFSWIQLIQDHARSPQPSQEALLSLIILGSVQESEVGLTN